MALALLAWVLAGASHAQEARRPRVEPALARALAEPAAAQAALRAQASSSRARAGELRVIAEPGIGRSVDDLPLARIRELGARIDGRSRSRVRIAGPPAALARVAELAGIDALRFPLRPIPVDGAGPRVSEAVGLTGGSALQSSGHTGAGVDVAVLDLGFWRLAEAKTAGEIPANAIPVDLVGAGIEAVTSHGTAVAEQVADMAPGARLHLILFDDDVDFENAVDYVHTNGIRIANLSVNWFNTSYYDDTGPISALINDSHDAHGVFWSVGGGNWGYRHWRGGWLDEDADRWLSFWPNDEQLDLIQEVALGAEACVALNWNQYAGTPQTDLDLYVYSAAGAAVATSANTQGAGSGAPPAEYACFARVSSDEPYTARVRRKPGGTPPAGLDITLVSSNVTIASAERVAASSLVDPAVAHGAFAVGAIDAARWNDAPTPPIESLSSRGPTTDGRTKPELVAPDRTNSLTRPYVPGTSFAAPVVAGAAALLLGQNSNFTALQLRATLTAAAQDVGPAGQDDTYGYGKLVVPVVPPGPDADADLVQDAFDNCPFTANTTQLDANSDGIGDACQCGDLSGDGLISSADEDLLRAWLSSPAAPPAGLLRCNVIGPAVPSGADCRIDDRAVLARELASAGPGLAQACAPALP
ncbi:MAG: hypothetical protein FJ108_13395 [Deltaproteobacteria bacterium]|nr:hypothetical protein [Deltaproteobacteria bacterium]